MSDDSRSSGTAVHPDRLNGWKDIASYLGRSTRTVQRWERELELPVRRIAAQHGDIVFALRSEIDDWQRRREVSAKPDRDGEAPEPGPRSLTPEQRSAATPRWRSHLPLVATTIVLASLLVALGIAGRRGGGMLAQRAEGDTPRPSSWRVEDNQLIVYDQKHAILWKHRFDFPLDHQAYQAGPSTPLSLVVAIEDLEGDGPVETLFVARTPDGSHSAVYCFEENGGVRFSHRVDTGVHYGREMFAPPFPISQVRLTSETSDGGGKKSIWLVASHQLWFATVVRKLSPDGTVMGEFWNDGHVALIQPAVLDGRAVLLVGGTNNEYVGGVLAALDPNRPSGSAPADSVDYRCQDCPPGEPIAYLVFPRMEISQELKTRPFVHEVNQSGQQLTVTVTQANDPLPGYASRLKATVFYTVNFAFQILQAECGDEYAQAHARLELLGRLRHAFSGRCAKSLCPVLQWRGSSFAPVTTTIVQPRIAG